MSRSDSTGRAGRRRARRARPSRYPRDEYEPLPNDYDEESPPDLEEEAPAGESRSVRKRGGPGRSRKARRSRRGGAAPVGDDTHAASAEASPGPSRRPRKRAAGAAGLDPVSKFSASALQRVTVLGDRPSQMVYSLAEQSRRKRGTAILATLLALCVVSLVALLGVLGYQVVAGGPGSSMNSDTALVDPPEGHSTLLPELYQGEQKQSEIFKPIEERPENAKPLSEKAVFGSVDKLEIDEFSLLLEDSEATDTCTSVAWGERVQQSLADAACSSAARGVYQDQDKKYVAQFTLFDLADSSAASDVATALNPETEGEPGFVLPMTKGMDGLHHGYSQATTQVMGHYLAVVWVARTDGKDPSKDDAMATVNVVAMDAATWVYQQVGKAKEKQG